MKLNQFNPLPELHTKRLLLRKVSHSDAEDIFSFWSIPKIAKYTFSRPHETIEETHEYISQIEAWYEEGQLGRWSLVLKDTGNVIGLMGFGLWLPEHKRGEVDASIHPNYWNQNLATEALEKILDFGFTHANMNRIEAYCFSGNKGSERVLEKCGMSLDGILKQYYWHNDKAIDLKLYSLLKQKWLNQPTKLYS